VTRDPVGSDPTIVWQGRKVQLRPLLAEDAADYLAFHASLHLPGGSHASSGRLPPPDEYATRVVDDREVTIAAVSDDAAARILGIARATLRSDKVAADAAIVLRPELEGLGLGRLLLGMLIIECRARGARELLGEMSADDQRMIELAQAFCFVTAPSAAIGQVSLRLELAGAVAD
jgi:acetyltransferase